MLRKMDNGLTDVRHVLVAVVVVLNPKPGGWWCPGLWLHAVIVLRTRGSSVMVAAASAAARLP